MKDVIVSGWRVGLIAVLTCAVVWAQATAQITGTAKDQSGAVLPGVEITVTQTDTGITRSTITNETGSYVLPNLPIGPYRLEGALPGFRTYVQRGIVLQVNSSPAINVVLEVGPVAETVEVQADAALVETRSVGVGQVMENTRILELPLDGRQVTELVALAGAATMSTTGINARNPFVTSTVAVAGRSATGLHYALDGANHNNPFFNTYMSTPFPDALQEFKVETSGTSAQSGVKSAGSVNLVTKSGTNEFHGNLFHFVRNGMFNARNAFGTRRDTMKRNQFGGTLGGPVVRDRLFFFGAYQATSVRQDPSDRITYVPTAAMLAGDFTDFASPACNRGRRITLRAPFANNRVDPALFSKPAVALAKRLPMSSHPCGEIIRGDLSRENRHMVIGRIDYQRSANHSVFGRFLIDSANIPPPYSISNDLLSVGEGNDNLSQSYTAGNTYLFAANVVNAFRLTANHWDGGRIADEYFSWPDLGVKMFTYEPKRHAVNVTGGFSYGPGGSGRSALALFGANEDLSVIRGNHQMAFGAQVAVWWANSYSDFYSYGRAAFNGELTGLGMADFFVGHLSEWLVGSPAPQHKRSKNAGLYGADVWRVNPKLTLNYGLRWEPFFPQIHLDGAGINFDLDRWRRGVKTTQFDNAPAGLFFQRDPGFPGRQAVNTQWWNFSPRVGLAWDVEGNGRTSVRASVGTFYDYPSTHSQNGMTNSPPWSARTAIQGVKLEDPWANFPGGDPFPMPYGKYVTRDVPWPLHALVISYDPNSPFVNSYQWNLSLQRQIGTDWLVSASYLGSNSIHTWSTTQTNPAVYIPGVGDASGKCFLNGQAVSFTVRPGSACSTTGNTNERRRLMLENREAGRHFGYVHRIDSGGTASYHGLVLSVQRRAVRGITINANHTWSRCISDPGGESFVSGSGTGGWRDPENRRFDRGNCGTDRRHNFNLSAVASTPQFSSPTLRAVASGWRLSTIYRVLSGSYMSVSTRDRALNGISGQRADQILPNPYGDKSVNNYLNPAAFAPPALGTLGNQGDSSILGPGTWQFDAALSRTFQFHEAQRLEFRAEAFNVTNSFRMNNPNTTQHSGDFGRVTSARDPRIMQFALKYFF